jgi:hypothetical protein
MAHLRFYDKYLNILLFSAILAGCGLSTGTAGGAYDDPVPSGTVIETGTFLGCNPNTLTGSTAIYDQGGGNYVLRLISLNGVPNQSLEVAVNGAAGRIFATPLKGTSGNQNYSFTVNPVPTWTTVAIEPLGTNPSSPSPICQASI